MARNPGKYKPSSQGDDAEAAEDLFGDIEVSGSAKPKKVVLEEEDEEEDEDEPVNTAEPTITKKLSKKAVERASKPSGRVTKRPPPDGRIVQGRRTLKLGPERKLTKAQKLKLSGWNGSQRGKLVDKLFKGSAELARKESGHHGVFLGSETKDLILGIPIPALAFEFLIAQDVFPLGIILQLVAKWGTGKSGLLAEFYRWFGLAGGGAYHNENESKFSPEWFESIMGFEYYDRMQLNRCVSVESWQKHTTADIKRTKKLMTGTEKEPGPGRTIPVCFGTDSIMGKNSEATQESISKEGAAGRGFPIEALGITRYMKDLPGWLDGWPFSVVLVNHLKIKTDKQGNEERSTAGGCHVNFQESLELEMKKIGKQNFECADFEGFKVNIKCHKNSIGVTGREITTRVLWWEEEDPETGDMKQKTVWDWDWATVNMLYAILETKDRYQRLRKNLKDVGFDMDFASPQAINGSTAWSDFMGVSQKKALGWNEMGALIRKTPAAMAALRKALRIVRRPVLAGDYSSQLDDLAEEMP